MAHESPWTRCLGVSKRQHDARAVFSTLLTAFSAFILFSPSFPFLSFRLFSARVLVLQAWSRVRVPCFSLFLLTITQPPCHCAILTCPTRRLVLSPPPAPPPPSSLLSAVVRPCVATRCTGSSTLVAYVSSGDVLVARKEVVNTTMSATLITRCPCFRLRATMTVAMLPAVAVPLP